MKNKYRQLKLSINGSIIYVMKTKSIRYAPELLKPKSQSPIETLALSRTIIQMYPSNKFHVLVAFVENPPSDEKHTEVSHSDFRQVLVWLSFSTFNLLCSMSCQMDAVQFQKANNLLTPSFLIASLLPHTYHDRHFYFYSTLSIFVRCSFDEQWNF